MAKQRERLEWVDGLRGLAIVLMVLDHVLFQVDPDNILRFTLTRTALPLFMATAAMVWRGRPSNRRLAQLGLAALIEVPLTIGLGMPMPGILTVFVLLVVMLWQVPIIQQKPGIFAALGLIQTIYIPDPLPGYDLGLVLAWWCLGALAAKELEPLGARLPAWCRAIGRGPLTWYLAHLTVIWIILMAVGV